MLKTTSKLDAFVRLTRLNRPIGIYLVLWPAMWSLWIASDGIPSVKLLVIFILGSICMRSAGCVINDYADRHIDGMVQRTKMRPLITGEVQANEALALFVILCLLAFILVLFTNGLTVGLAVGAAVLAGIYPFMKRITNLPQVVLGTAFAFSVPMAFAAQLGNIPQGAWVVFTAVILWTACYDTFYAMVDRPDDIQAGIKSTAVLLGDMDRPMTACLQASTVLALLLAGAQFELGIVYFIGVLAAAALFGYQQYLIRERDRKACFSAFMNNNWVGIVVFAGIVADRLLGNL